MKWYILKAQTNRENKVMESIIEQSKIDGIEDRIESVLVPQEKVIESRSGGQKRTIQRRFYPGYVFLKTDMSDQVKLSVKKVRYATGFIGDNNPTPMMKHDIEKMISLEAEGNSEIAPKYKVSYDIGEEIRITDGPFDGFTGIVKLVNYENSIINTTVEVFGRATEIDISFDDIAKQ